MIVALIAMCFKNENKQYIQKNQNFQYIIFKYVHLNCFIYLKVKLSYISYRLLCMLFLLHFSYV